VKILAVEIERIHEIKVNKKEYTTVEGYSGCTTVSKTFTF
jgi:hypothetical protein